LKNNYELGKDELQKKVDDYLNFLFDRARIFCARVNVDTMFVPLFFLATAGMRHLEEDDQRGQNQRYGEFLSYIKKSTKASEFDVKECGTITGEAEALYGWIAANYSLGSFSGYGLRSSQAVGYVEMGGASTQIALPLYADNREELDRRGLGKGGLDDFVGRLVKVDIGPSEFDLFLGSYALGSDVTRKQYERVLFKSGNKDSDGVCVHPSNGAILLISSKTILEPSKNRGWEGKLCDPACKPPCKPAKGSLNAAILTKILKNILSSTPIDNSPQRLKEVIQTRSFVGGSNFWYSAREVFGRDSPKNSPFSFKEYEDEMRFVGQVRWEDYDIAEPDVREAFRATAYFTATWIHLVLFDFFGFLGIDQTGVNEDKLLFRPYNGSDGDELSWTLGKVVLFALDSRPREMDAKVVRDVNAMRKQAESLKDEAHRMRVEAKRKLIESVEAGQDSDAFHDYNRLIKDERDTLDWEKTVRAKLDKVENKGVAAIPMSQRWLPRMRVD
jgi:Golgi apyrase